MTDLGPTPTLRIARSQAMDLARLLDTISADLEHRAATLSLITATLNPIAPLSPGTAAAADLALLAATLGPTGLLAVGVSLTTTATSIRQAVGVIVGADEALALASPWAESGMGGMLRALPGPGLGAGHAVIEGYAGVEGGAVITPTEVAVRAPAPTRFSDLIGQLATVNDSPDGTIRVLGLTSSDGQRRFVVYLPGTDSLDRGAVRSWPANASIRLGHPTTYQAGVMAALTSAGVGSTDPVLLVGHSQGGMVAAEIARTPGPFTISGVVTAGSPIGDRQPPASTDLLALENTGDPVPTLDGTPNPEGGRHHTLRFSDGLGPPIANHRLGHYLEGARAAEQSTDPDVVRALAGVRPFLGPTAEVETRTWVISRADE